MTDTSPKRRSVSQLLEYLDCQEKYRLKRVEGIVEKPCIWQPAGTAFHSAIESFGQELFYDLQGAPEAYARKFQTQFEAEVNRMSEESGVKVTDFEKSGVTKDRPEGYDYNWWLADGAGMVIHYCEWLRDDEYEILDLNGEPAVELEFEYPFDDVPVKGYIDLVVKDRAGNIIVIDAKTGVRMPNAVQLGVYAAVLERQYGVPVPYGAFFKAREGKLLRIKMLTFLKNYAGLSVQFGMMDRSERSGIYIPSLSEDCERCMVRDYCRFYNEAWS